MVQWQEVETAAPELATPVRAAFEATLHHVMATLRADGSPRVSGTEIRFWEGDAWLGAMPGSRKVADLRRDARVAVHAGPIDLKLVNGDAKVSGTAVEETDPAVITAYLQAVGFEGDDTGADAAALFRLALDRVTLTQVAGDELVITSWSPAHGLTEQRRT